MKLIKRKNTIDLLSLTQYQEITIEKEKYRVLNKVKYIEKSSFWYEYKLEKIDNKSIYYLNVELSQMATLYQTIEKTISTDETDIKLEDKKYSLYETGRSMATICFGTCDLTEDEEIRYYEYICQTNENEVISVEKWKDKQEISIGHIINSSIK